MAKNANLSIYDAVRKVPDAAKKPINGGRLKGMTDINPMWRLKTLTEQFGPCGVGWKYVITDKRMEKGAKEEVAVFVDIDLYIKVGDAWSDAIPGTGGSMFVASERNGLYTSDECYKMALTDAISVACKALGFGADVYWEKDRTKYTQPEEQQPAGKRQAPPREVDEAAEQRLWAIATAHGIDVAQVKRAIVRDYKKTTVQSLSKTEYEELCARLSAPKQPAAHAG
jgi:hypothetical protein